MRNIILNFIFIFSSVLSQGNISRHNAAKLLLVSLDGFRWDYLDRTNLKLGNFTNFYSDGVRAKWMTNQFQTKTFPNHWTMVTGLYEESHGIVANQFYDPIMNKHFVYTDPTTWKNESSFWGGEPLWITNQKNGGKTGCEFWVGSEVINRTPTYYDSYNFSKPFIDRVDAVVNWLKEPEVNLGLLYMEEPDHTGHVFGPESKEVDRKLEELNDVIGYLISELKKNEVYENTNIIITSDHGMTSIDEEHLILLDPNNNNQIRSLMNMNETKLMTNSGFIFPKNQESKDILLEKLKEIRDTKFEGKLDVWSKEEIPSRYHYTNNQRIPEIVIAAKGHYSIWWDLEHWNNRGGHLLGQHGWVPETVDMHPIFMARGPDFVNAKRELDPFPNIDLYSLCCHLLQLEPAPNNGTLNDLQAYLAQPMDLVLPVAMGVLFVVFIIGVIIYAVYSQFWKWRPQTLINDSSHRTNIQYEGL